MKKRIDIKNIIIGFLVCLSMFFIMGHTNGNIEYINCKGINILNNKGEVVTSINIDEEEKQGNISIYNENDNSGLNISSDGITFFDKDGIPTVIFVTEGPNQSAAMALFDGQGGPSIVIDASNSNSGGITIYNKLEEMVFHAGQDEQDNGLIMSANKYGKLNWSNSN